MQTRTARDGLLFAVAVAVVVIGWLDYATGPSISMTLFYLAPVVVAGWTLGRVRALCVALFAGSLSLVDVASGPTTAATFVWNVISRTCVLAIAALAVEKIRSDRDRLLTQDAQRARSVELLDLGLANPARQLLELAEHWDGSVGELKALVRRRADEMLFLARDFSALVRAQNSVLPLESGAFDFVELMKEVREEQEGRRPVLMTTPSTALMVRGDRERTRQVLSAVVAERPLGEDLSFALGLRGRSAELVISSGTYQPGGTRTRSDSEVLGLSVELAEVLFRAQGGSVEMARNPLTSTLRITARLPLAT
ncbi:MAG: hypothetical protein ABI469_11585 [Gemmatimonadales bacterium]